MRRIFPNGPCAIMSLAGRLAGMTCLCLGLCGCAGFWDEVTSREFKLKSLFVKKEPLVVLRDSTDGDERAKAIRKLREPKQHGGSDQEQDLIVKILIEEAARSRQPLCRLAAIQQLGHFKDPRVVRGLEDAFYNTTAFAPDIATRIQCQSLLALGETGDPEAASFLIKILGEPPAEGSLFAQQRNDRCIAAARALGNFKDLKTTEALAEVLKNNKEDLALRDRATESLQTATGKDLPADYQAWNGFLHPQDAKSLAEQKGRKIDLVGWFFK